ncbi:hemolysin-type calcium binding protein [Herbaspirillum frisingense GSF30]|uniref:Hemolysin-type calcium binding protein n=2 Tax=Herbaspirillum frisingense TaxID=92645 RepID=A0AAI9IFB5_9BURK|nr:hemolysin-type calcium binding protein [Herbaspirillum frisingense GSF30]
MEKDQAKFIAANFEVIASENKRDIPLPGSGFDATVWRGRVGRVYAGEIYVSFRGTQAQDGGAGIEADVDLASRGVGHNQVRDMVNWWMRIGFYDGAVYSKAMQIRFADRAEGGLTATVLNAKYTYGNVLDTNFNWNTNGKLTNVATSHTAGGYGLASMSLYGLPAFDDDKVLVGDAGNDTVDYRASYLAGAGIGIDASLARGTVILGDGADTLIGIENLGGTDAADRLVGDANDNRIEGYGGNDILSGGRGNDILIGGSGNDTYLYSAGDGKDILVDHDKTGRTDMLMLTDIDRTQLWFRHVGNDLQIDVLGTADQIRVKDWYVGGASGADNHIERIRTADGSTLYDSDVDKLVQAMAAFAPPEASQTRWTTGQVILA